MVVCKWNTRIVHIPIQHSPWTVDSCSACRHILNRLLNLYCIHKDRRRMFPILSWLNSTQIIKSHSSKLNFSTKLTLQPVHRPHEWSPSFMFSDENSVIISSLLRMLHEPQSLCSKIFCAKFGKENSLWCFISVNPRFHDRYIRQIFITRGYLPRRGNGALVQILTTYPFPADCR
jgi:hypothetical protein